MSNKTWATVQTYLFYNVKRHITLPEQTRASYSTNILQCQTYSTASCRKCGQPLIVRKYDKFMQSYFLDYPNNIGSEGPIPDGLPENGYMVEIVARAYDHDGAFADALTYIRVSKINIILE